LTNLFAVAVTWQLFGNELIFCAASVAM